MAQSQKILDLDSLYERAIVKIDGTPYELRNYYEFSVVDGVKLQRLSKRFQEILVGAYTASDEELDEVTEILEKISKLIFVSLPREDLSDQQMQDVLGFFSQQIEDQKQRHSTIQKQPKSESQPSPIGGKSFADSAGSTAAGRVTG